MLVETNTNKEYLILNRCFPKGETCVVAADPGVGKTNLALEVAKNLTIKKNVYFELDDGFKQKERLENIPSIYPIYLPEFESNLERFREIASLECFQQATKDVAFKYSARVNDRQLKLMRHLGVGNDYKIDELLLFEIFVEEAIQSGADLITLDTLSSLVKNPSNITHKYVRRISKKCRENNISLLILQHTNKKGEYSGTSGLAQVVDTLLLIEDLGGNLRRLIVKKSRFEKNREGCIFQIISEGENSVRFEVCENHDIPSKNNFSPMGNRILEIIGDNDFFNFDDLIIELGSSNENSVKNQLLSLEKNKVIKKADGKTWDKIQICRE